MMYFADELFDGQLLRTVGHCTYGGAEVGECWAAASEVRSGDRESWYRAWIKLADRTSKAAEASRRAGRRVSALRAFLRASNYYRNAYVLHLEVPLPALVREAYRKHRDAFGAAAALMRRPAERLAIPFEGGVLPGYFVPAPEGGARPLVISVGGYDSTAEESYFFNAAAAGERGYHALVFDGPGQGELLIERGVPFRPDWEKVLDAVLDAAVARPDVDARRIAIIGESFGGYLAPRAALDRRVAACILDPAQIGLFRAVRRRLPLPASISAQLPGGPTWARTLLRFVLSRVARHPTKGWALRRGMLTHGVATPWDYILETARYEQESLLEQIPCPTLVCDAESDDIAAFAKEFYDRLTCPKAYLRFTAAEGAGAHCIGGNRALFHERAFDWLDSRFEEAALTAAA
jgi:alpha-beta hydrolase superfamily lysophospholipase